MAKTATLIGAAVAAASAVCVLSAAAWAVPAALPYVGYLTHEAGAPYHGAATVQARMYPAADASSPHWGPSAEKLVDVADGVFSFVLGGASDPIDASALAHGEVWLELTVNGVTMLPRQRILAVPYARMAADAQALGGLPASAYSPTDALPAVALSGSYEDLLDKPDLSVGHWDTNDGGIHYAAGSVTVGSATSAASAALSVHSNSQGFLPPRLTTIQRNAIASPAEGLFIYNTTAKRPEFFNGVTWQSWGVFGSHEWMTIYIPHNNWYYLTEVEIFPDSTLSNNLTPSMTSQVRPGVGLSGLGPGEFVFDSSYSCCAPAPLGDGSYSSGQWNSSSSANNNVHLMFSNPTAVYRVRLHFAYISSYGDPRTSSITFTTNVGQLMPISQTNASTGSDMGYREFVFSQ